ncbi:DUF1178 family protein [Pseudoruegeria sp. HB172150]|uniref:DUF1178 family protein n=1 Tax=Pseudoruegeria sp. HB172150 TaxID=2721164 RepID=UPI001551F19D|nr:DUF1178 family protein [Pseudoruegeria sp. HB172150]
MIRYALKCNADHAFESWFASAGAFDSLKAAGMVVCPECGSTEVEKTLMAPRVRPARKAAPAPAAETKETALTKPANEVEEKLAELRKHVEANSDYVGLSFAAEARKMHDGEIPHRSIYGEAKADEAKALLEDGVPVAPLPFMPTRKTN